MSWGPEDNRTPFERAEDGRKEDAKREADNAREDMNGYGQ